MNLVKEINEYREEINNIQSESSNVEEVEIDLTENIDNDNVQSEGSDVEIINNFSSDTAEVFAHMVSIPIINLYDWIEKYIIRESTNIRRIRLEMNDIESDTVILKSINLSNPDFKELFLLKNTNKIIILDLPYEDIMCYRNGAIKINTNLSNAETENIRCYVTGSGIHYFSMYKKTIVENEETKEYMIPYFYTKIKNRDIKSINIVDFSKDFENISNNIESILEEDVNKENIMLLYKPFSKSQESVNTNLDLIKYFDTKYNDVIDINHHLVIDNILLKIFSN